MRNELTPSYKNLEALDNSFADKKRTTHMAAGYYPIPLPGGR